MDRLFAVADPGAGVRGIFLVCGNAAIRLSLWQCGEWAGMVLWTLSNRSRSSTTGRQEQALTGETRPTLVRALPRILPSAFVPLAD
jgi:hypothetical protein